MQEGVHLSTATGDVGLFRYLPISGHGAAAVSTMWKQTPWDDFPFPSADDSIFWCYRF